MSLGRRAGGNREGGIALILTLMVLAILIILVTQFAWSTKVERTIAHNSKDDLKMLFAARGSVALVRAHLRADRAAGKPFDSLREDWADPSLSNVQIGDVTIHLRLEDTERFLNVNLLCDPATKAFAADTLARLAEHLGHEGGKEVVERIVDYLDQDSEGQYESGARNQPLFHAGELLEMAGLTPEAMQVLVGTPADPETGESKPGLLEFLTASGSRKVNLNTVPLDLMWAILPEQDGQQKAIDRDAAIQAIDEYRTGASEAGGTSTGDSTGTSTSTSASTTALDSLASAQGTAEEKPGKDFEKIEDLLQIPGLGALFPAQAAKGGAGAGAGSKDAPPNLRNFLTVAAEDFRLLVEADRAGLRKHYEVVLRRGRDAFDILLWREVAE